MVKNYSFEWMRKDKWHISARAPLMYSQGIKAVSKNGVLGDSRKGEARNGEEYLELWAEKMVDFVRKQVDI